jgi:magnesium-transporting ATPase (P-type)
MSSYTAKRLRSETTCVMDTAAVSAALNVSPERGLAEDEAVRRLAQHGPNELRAAASVPRWRRVVAQLEDPLIYLLIGAIAISLADTACPSMRSSSH